MLSARPRSVQVKQLGLTAHPKEGSRGAAPRKFMNFRPARRLKIALSTLRRALLTLKNIYIKVEGRKTE